MSFLSGFFSFRSIPSKNVLKYYTLFIGFISLSIMIYFEFFKYDEQYSSAVKEIKNNSYLMHQVGKIISVDKLSNKIIYRDSAFYFFSVVGTKKRARVVGKVIRQNNRWALVTVTPDTGQFETMVHFDSK